jgi:hypothetical protein
MGVIWESAMGQKLGQFGDERLEKRGGINLPHITYFDSVFRFYRIGCAIAISFSKSRKPPLFMRHRIDRVR